MSTAKEHFKIRPLLYNPNTGSGQIVQVQYLTRSPKDWQIKQYRKLEKETEDPIVSGALVEGILTGQVRAMHSLSSVALH